MIAPPPADRDVKGNGELKCPSSLAARIVIVAETGMAYCAALCQIAFSKRGCRIKLGASDGKAPGPIVSFRQPFYERGCQEKTISLTWQP